MEKITHQHGDLIIKKIEKIPTTAVKKEIERKYVLLKGEGVNTHELIWDNEQDVQIFEESGEIYLEIINPIKLTHIEHGIQTIEEGTYKRVIEKEFDYEEMEERNVKD